MDKHSQFAVVNDFCALEVIGAQAESFLQGQLTCDIKTLQPGQAILGAGCDHKGRMLFNGWVGRWQENYSLFLPKNMLAVTQEHLKKFAVFSKVTLSETTDWTAVVYSGATLPSLPTQEYIHGQLPHFLHWIIGRAQSLQTIQTVFAQNAALIDSSQLQFLLVLNHLVFIQSATRELFIPQMIGLEKLGGVSFTKGCYVGQEVVARTQHLGQLKRHLQILQIPSAQSLQTGDSLIDGKNEVIGHIAAVSADPNGGYRVLAVIQDRALTAPIFAGHQQALLILES